MTSVVELYEQLASAPDDKTRARLIAEAFERMEERYPEVKDLATQTHLRETELRLQKEIEQLRGDLSREIAEARAESSREIEQLRGDLSREIAEVRAESSKEIEQFRGELSREIAQARTESSKEIEQLRGGLTREIAQARTESSKEIEQLRSDAVRWVVGLLAGQTAVILAALFAVARM